MFAADIFQLLEMEGVGEEGAEPLHDRIVAPLGEYTSLPVVPGDTIQLGNEAQKDTSTDDNICHKISFTLLKNSVRLGIVRPVAFSVVSTVFPVRKVFYEVRSNRKCLEYKRF